LSLARGLQRVATEIHPVGDMRKLWMMVSAAAAAASLAAAAPAGAAQVLNVDWNSGCGKTTCFDDNGAYRQSWSSHDVSGPVTIGQILILRLKNQ